jgi:hypothetical protein
MAELVSQGVVVDRPSVDAGAEQQPVGVGGVGQLGEDVVEEDVVGGQGGGFGQGGVELVVAVR